MSCVNGSGFMAPFNSYKLGHRLYDVTVLEVDILSTSLQEHSLLAENVDEIIAHWRKDWSDRSRSETVRKHGPGFFRWSSEMEGLRGSGMFYRAEMIDQALAPSDIREEVRARVGQIDHETSVVVMLVFQKTHQATVVTVSKSAQPRPQAWFEMPDVRNRSAAKTVWIPLRASCTVEEAGKMGHEGYVEEYYGLGSVMFDTACQDKVADLGWSDIGLGNDYTGGMVTHYTQAGSTRIIQELASARIPFTNRRLRLQLEVPSKSATKESTLHWVGDCEGHRLSTLGTGLVIEQRLEHPEHCVWHLHQDFVITLGLLQEDDTWVRPDEGYVEVARMKRDEFGRPVLLEVRAEHLRDYLKARSMNLHISSYRSRRQTVEDISHIDWKSEHEQDGADDNRWEGITLPIHEGGAPFGSQTAVFHASRTDVDHSEDVPVVSRPTDDSAMVSSWSVKHQGRKLFDVSGELWRTEVVPPGRTSERVMGEDIASSVEFIVDPSGERLKAPQLVNETRWLWFRPNILATMSGYRGASLSWFTRYTGRIGFTHSSAVHFGINDSGLLNVFAKDIGMLPMWQQQVWAGANTAPEGGVSQELMASQMDARPASTKAPEVELRRAHDAVNEQMTRLTDLPLFKHHHAIEDIFGKTHRFRALDKSGLLELAKDLARVTVESMDGVALAKLAAVPAKMKAGSIKHLETVLAGFIDQAEARKITAVLVGVNELRQADAHLPSQDLDKAMNLAGITQRDDTVTQALQMLDSLVASLSEVAQILSGAPHP